jgi:hypothetical protein
MAVASVATGSLTSSASEQDLSTQSAANVWVLAVDTAAMANGDEIILRIYGKARTGDTERLIYQSRFMNVQSDPLKLSPPVPTPHHLRCTLQRISGTDRAYPWELRSL